MCGCVRGTRECHHHEHYTFCAAATATAAEAFGPAMLYLIAYRVLLLAGKWAGGFALTTAQSFDTARFAHTRANKTLDSFVDKSPLTEWVPVDLAGGLRAQV